MGKVRKDALGGGMGKNNGKVDVQEIPIEQVFVIENHRSNIDKTHLDELMLSIKQHGLKQPIGVRLDGKNHYTLLFGHRRLLACQKLGWETVSASVHVDVDTEKLLVLNLTENIQRKDPSFAEMGRVISKLIKMGLNHKEAAARIGISVDKVKAILGVYQRLPEKHRSKIQFPTAGVHKKKGALTPHVATSVIHLKKKHQLTEKQCDDLIDYIQESESSREDINNIGMMLSCSLELKEAIENLHEYHVYHVDIVANRLDISKAIHASGCPNYQNYFRKIVYATVKKPDFVKV